MIRLFQRSVMTFFLMAIGGAVLMGAPHSAHAQNVPAQYASSIANSCLNNWKTLKCYVAVSDSNLVLVANYISKLKTAGRAGDAEKVKQQCAAATAVRKFAEQGGKDLPVNAMSEALTVCINQMYDSIAATNVQPDMDHYQLLLVPTLCLRDDPRCKSSSAALKPYLSQRR